MLYKWLLLLMYRTMGYRWAISDCGVMYYQTNRLTYEWTGVTVYG